MKKRNILFSSVLGVVLAGGLGYGGVYAINSAQPVKEFRSQGKSEPFESFEDMERKSTLIVIGKKLDKEVPTFLEDGDGGILGGYTISDVEVKEVIKNTTGDEMGNKTVIKVLENAASGTISHGQKVTYSVNGYELMKESKHYILIMDESSSDEGVYIPMGAVIGKVPLDGKDGELEIDIEVSDEIQREWIAGAVKKYKAKAGAAID